MKKKFEIIEDGRLSKSEMQTLAGGLAYFAEECPGGSADYSTGICTKSGESYSTCIGELYASCTSTSLTSCSGRYVGPTGPNGYC